MIKYIKIYSVLFIMINIINCKVDEDLKCYKDNVNLSTCSDTDMIIYTCFLRNLCSVGYRSILLHEVTNKFIINYTLGRKGKRNRELFYKDFKNNLIDIDTSLLSEFKKIIDKTLLIDCQRLKSEIVNSMEITCIPPNLQNNELKNFLDQYTNRHIISFSRTAYSTNRKFALLFYTTRFLRSRESGGYIVIFQFKDERWSILKEIRLWHT